MRRNPRHVLAIPGPLAVAAVAGFVACIEVAPAQAQWWEDQPRREWRRSSTPSTPKVDETAFSREIKHPLMAIVSLNDQRVTIYDANGKLVRAPVSSGSTGNETPVGLFTVIQKNRDHVSNIYEGAAMPFMQRITWSGIALHAGALPGYPASHGCVRLPYKFAENLFEASEKGMRVVVVRNDMSPADISHPALFSPPAATVVAKAAPGAEREQPMRLGAGDVAADSAPSYFDKLKRAAADKAEAADAAAKAAGAARLRANRLTAEAARDATFLKNAEFVKGNIEAQLKQAEAMLAAARNPAQKGWAEQAAANARKRLEDANARLAAITANPKLEAAQAARAEAADAEKASKALMEEAKAAQRKLLPISVLVSRAAGKLYVRQGLDPILEVPVTIRDADKPIGTTLFTALGPTKDGTEVRWNAVQMYAKGAEPDLSKPATMARRVALKSAEPTPTSVEEAKAALDRLDIPKEARDLISEVVAPGSSLIVTDHEISKETGGGTDFIVVMPGEPAGGLIIRPKRPSASSYDDDDDRPRRRRRYNPDAWW